MFTKYEDLPEGYPELLKADGCNINPLHIILPTKVGIRFKWSAAKLMIADTESKSSFDLLGYNYCDTLKIEPNWIPVATDLFPNLPSENGRIEWSGMVLCATSLPEVDVFINNHEKEILDVLIKRVKFSKSLGEAIEGSIEARFNKIDGALESKFNKIRNKYKSILKQNIKSMDESFSDSDSDSEDDDDDDYGW